MACCGFVRRHSYNMVMAALLAVGLTTVEAQAPDGCTFALGMKSGYIKDDQLTASSWNTTWYYQPWGARLNGTKAWQTNTTDPSPWLQVDLRPPVIPRYITSVQTQGLWAGWVASYTVEISNDTTDWILYENGKNFTGNNDGGSVVQVDVDPPIFANFLRIYPNTCHGTLCRLRMELIGCDGIDHCVNVTCLNNGTCIDGLDDYRCACVPGYTGKDCEINIDECVSGPCQNGGTCIDGVNGYSCACAPGYTNQTCGIDIDECLSKPCQNGGTCTDGIDSYNCTCAAGYTGLTCQLEIDECQTGPCQNGGSCINGVDDYSCTCAPGYTGQTCGIDIDECVPGLCQNGGSCIDGVNGYSCTCAPGYTGQTCVMDLDLSTTNLPPTVTPTAVKDKVTVGVTEPGASGGTDFLSVSAADVAWIALWTAVAVAILLLLIIVIALCCCLVKTWKKDRRVESKEELILAQRDSAVGVRRPRPHKLSPAVPFPAERGRCDTTKKSPPKVSLTDVETPVVIPRPYVRSYNSPWDPLDF
ncbi:neurogenic locus notch homolog protein 1-like [Branchiostoma floridae]|uniref:Neurogenic locus notch homolog protein 1-like n=1 Tax=Branchiostoma floridae TaxID=7739 RepID=A0A9J7HH13_BRAFL|nr:neurogenic locus notch homolog protein 1-like [Branchiostoma floridae]